MTELEQFARDLYAAAPGLREAVRGDADPDPDIPTLWAGTVGRAVAATLTGLSPDDRAATFAVIERHLAGGSQLLRDVISTGLLEALASEVSGGRLDGPTLAGLLGPQSRAYLDAWDQLTLGRSSLEPS